MILTYDAAPGDVLEEGDVLVSMRGRARYLILAARRVRSVLYPSRWRLVVERADSIEVVDGEPWPLYWNPRGQRR
jgi:archaeosine-15-forming tRNA-guanine transglycosylase